jgi:hypothetical protein
MQRSEGRRTAEGGGVSYGKVKDTFWTDKKIQSFSDDAKMLALYFMTGPHRNILGCMRVPDGYIRADLGWSSDRLNDAIAMLCERHFICRDDDGWTLILNQLRHDPIKVPNHARAAMAIANEVPADSVVFRELRPRLTSALQAIKMESEWHSNEIVIPEPLPEPLPNQNHIPAQPKGDAMGDEFKIWWEAFPRKTARGHALKAYRLARKKVSAEVLLAGANKYAVERRGQDSKFTAHPATWLNGERWADEQNTPANSSERVDPEKLTQAHAWAVKMAVHGKNDPSPSQVADLVRAGHITLRQGADYCFERPDTFADKHGIGEDVQDVDKEFHVEPATSDQAA